MLTITPLELRALRAVSEHAHYPTSAVVDALPVEDQALVKHALHELHRYGLLDRSGHGRRLWSLTPLGRILLAERARRELAS